MKPRHVYRPPRKNRFLSTAVIFAGGALFTFLVFFVIPLMRKLEQSTQKDDQDLVARISVEPEEEYQPPEEPEPEEEEPEPEPEMAEAEDDVMVDPLDLPDLGAGTGGKVMLNISPTVSLSGADTDVGGDIDQEPTVATAVDPQVPNSLKKTLSRKGTLKVIVGGLVNEKGAVVETSIAQSSGMPGLDQVAAKAFKRWKFKPAIRGGRKAKARVKQPFTFRGAR